MLDVFHLFALGCMAIWIRKVEKSLAIHRETVRYVIRELECVEGRRTSLTSVVTHDGLHTQN